MKKIDGRAATRGDLTEAVKRFEGILNGTIAPPKLKMSPRVKRLMAIFNLTEEDLKQEPYAEDLAGITNRSLERELQPVHEHLDELGEQVGDLQAGQKRLESGIQAILKHIESTDETLREHKTHPERIARLERSVFR